MIFWNFDIDYDVDSDTDFDNMKERNYTFDVMRIVACIMIICMHAPLPSAAANPLFLNATGYFMAPGLCLFFVLSGALLLPVQTDTFTFLRKRLSKVIAPTVCFSALYLALNALDGKEIHWLRAICSMPFSPQGYGTLWFMYTLVGLYLLSPILSRWLLSVSRRELEFYLMLWVVTLCYPLLSLWVATDLGNTGILFYCQGYVGYFVLGHYLHRYPDALSLRTMAIPTLIAIAAPVACKLLRLQVDFYSVFWYLCIFVAILTVFVYRLIGALSARIGGGNDKVMNFIVLLSNFSFGIYLIHIAVMRYWLWRQDWLLGIDNYYVQYVVIVVVTFGVSLLISWFLSLLPHGDWIVGYRYRRR